MPTRRWHSNLGSNLGFKLLLVPSGGYNIRLKIAGGFRSAGLPLKVLEDRG
ncbi:hypothetical protein NC652_030428 [Populus alba x Populus x berolinensis]|nr:hypothetical protein NC652_030428 [Populus alba x Populus x berolinensis]